MSHALASERTCSVEVGSYSAKTACFSVATSADMARARLWHTALRDARQADGGTRTASITGAYVAMHDAITYLLNNSLLTESPLTHAVAAISVGVYKGTPVLDLDYIEDSDCDTDMNIVMTSSGGFVEIQGTAEGEPFSRDTMNAMTDLAEHGIKQLLTLQKQALDI